MDAPRHQSIKVEQSLRTAKLITLNQHMGAKQQVGSFQTFVDRSRSLTKLGLM